MSTKKPPTEREARLQQLRAKQAGSERRRRGLIIGGAAALVVVLVAAVVVTVVRDQRANDPANIGVAASAASCEPVEQVAVAGVAEHVGPGMSGEAASILTVDYDSVPAVSGPHYVSPAYPAASFYTAENSPGIETLVHNLEHGYTIAWYTSALPADQLDALRAASEAMRTLDQTQSGKFIAAPWDETRGEFPGGQGLALAHWGADEGALQYCGAVSGEVFTSFVDAHPAADSPEPNAA